ncbi:hypothetical protein C8R43DRAFT_500155 [Mycena crocata]|nr:hypothetical protein C8R43DRAFT_500155 [Mycena crocata]
MCISPHWERCALPPPCELSVLCAQSPCVVPSTLPTRPVPEEDSTAVTATHASPRDAWLDCTRLPSFLSLLLFSAPSPTQTIRSFLLHALTISSTCAISKPISIYLSKRNENHTDATHLHRNRNWSYTNAHDMAAPTQALPPWLSFTTITEPQTTQTTLLYLPLTYYGPSIPLNSDWTYGGLTSPVSMTTSPTSTDTSATATSTSTTSLGASASSATPTSSLPSSTSQPASGTSSLTPSASTSASSSATPAFSASAPLSPGQLAGIIVGSVLGAVLLALLCCVCARICWRRRRRRDGETPSTAPSSGKSKTKFTALLPRRHRDRRNTRTRFTMLTPAVPGQAGVEEEEGDWTFVDSPTSPTHPGNRATTSTRGGIAESLDTRTFGSPTSPTFPTREMHPGQGGTEADPFLTRLPNPHPVGGAALGLAAGAAVVAARASGGSNNNSGSGSASSRNTGSTSASNSGSSGTNTSGYGVLLAHPSLGMPVHREEGGGGNPFDAPPGGQGVTRYANLPPGAAAAATMRGGSNGENGNAQVAGRRILSPAQMAILVEEDVLPRPRALGESDRLSAVEEGEEAEVVVARRVRMSPTATGLSCLSNPSHPHH